MTKYNSLEEMPATIRDKLSHYFTNVGGTTFVIHGLPSELTGGLLARYSRAATGIQLTLVNEFLDEHGEPSAEKGSKLMDRVLNAFGDDSVGELEGTHVGIEDISQVGTKLIEDRRIGGSPIEQSTRYVTYDQKDKQGKWRYFRPKEIAASDLAERYETVNNRAFEVYAEGVSRLREYFARQFPQDKFQIEAEREGKKVKISEAELENDEERKAFRNAYNFTIRCAALDVGRCVLPSSTLTHLGIYGNGRFFSHLITYLKSCGLEEGKSRGTDLETELNKVIPTFIKRNKEDPKLMKIDTAMRAVATELFRGIVPQDERVSLLPRSDLLDEVVSSSLFPYAAISLPQILQVVQHLPYEKKCEIAHIYQGDRENRRDRTGRGIETGYPLTFDLVGGFAEYRDLERHRMLTQQRQLLSTELGFVMPPEMGIVGLEKEVEEVVALMDELHSDVRKTHSEQLAQYTTLFNHRIRFMMGMNLREFQHLAELRTQLAGHFSYRGMVMEMARKVESHYPWAKDFFGFVNFSDPDNKISRSQEQSRIAGKNLASSIDSSLDLEERR